MVNRSISLLVNSRTLCCVTWMGLESRVLIATIKMEVIDRLQIFIVLQRAMKDHC